MSVEQSVERTLVVWCPDWPVAATGLPLGEPVAVLHANRVVATSPAARREGVHVGLRRREAQARCPEVTVLEHEPSRDAAVFEPVVATVESLAPRAEILMPGSCAVPTRGPSRYFGGDEALVQHVAMLVDETLRDAGVGTRCCVGVADGIFAAGLAARASMVVPPGDSQVFLAPQPISVLDRPELVDLLRRLGVRSLGDFAALPSGDVLGRFGKDGAIAHRLAQGLDEEPFHPRIPPLELSVSIDLDPPVQRVDTAAFAAKSLADRLHESLSRHGLACNRLAIEAVTSGGETLQRVWRHDGQLSVGAIAERLRWQLDGWLTRGGGDVRDEGFEPSSGLTLLRLVPEGLLPDNGRQLGFWGGSIDADERAGRALARVQGMLGEEAVVTAVRAGGRSPAQQVGFVPWGVSRESAVEKTKESPPWPGRLPTPSPATVFAVWPRAEVVDSAGSSLSVDGRGMVSGEPAAVAVDEREPVPVVAWAGPWLLDERWWDPFARRRRARMQLLTETGEALLVALEGRRWWVEALYD